MLAAANPVYGQYNPQEGPQENVALPDSLLSRFDLLFIMLDKMDPTTDRTLAEHVLRSHQYRQPGEADGEVMRIEKATDVVITENPDEGEKKASGIYETAGRGRRRGPGPKKLTVDFAKKYVMYAKAKCHPKLSKEAISFIASAYADIRSDSDAARSLPVTARTLETLIRLSTAHAKSRLSETVDELDARNAVSLVKYSYYNGTAIQTLGQNSDDESEAEMDDNAPDDDDDRGRGRSQGRSQSSQRSTRNNRDSEAASSQGRKASTPKSSKGKDKSKGKKAADPFAFRDDDGDDEDQAAMDVDADGDTAAKSTPSSGRRSGRRRAPSSGGVKPTSPEPEPESEIDTASAKKPATPTTKARPAPPQVSDRQIQVVRSTLQKMFADARAESMELSQLVSELEAKHPDVDFSPDQITVVLEQMNDDNECMLVDEMILKI